MIRKQEELLGIRKKNEEKTLMSKVLSVVKPGVDILDIMLALFRTVVNIFLWKIHIFLFGSRRFVSVR